MEQTITILIYVHALFGGLGLITGIGSMILKKGGKQHRKMGKLFSIGMVTSSLVSVPIAWAPGHENLFLFLIAVFTIYMVLAGNRSLTFKPHIKQKATTADFLISGSMLLFSIFMVGLGSIGLLNGQYAAATLYLMFGGFGLLFTIRDFLFYKRFTETKNAWLLNHIARMMGALIASITAFGVTGLRIESILAWIVPSVLGTIYIIYWRRKMKAKMAV